ncbi:MAG: hypothetical protein ACXVH2_00760 [Methanobacterium sp.]
MSERQKELLKWAVDTFGPIARDKEERVKRFAEEAIELCQACDLNYDDLIKLIDRVYDKPEGYISQEVGQTALCLSMLASVYDIDIADEAVKEFDRIQSFDKSYWQKRQNLKAALGIGGFCD